MWPRWYSRWQFVRFVQQERLTWWFLSCSTFLIHGFHWWLWSNVWLSTKLRKQVNSPVKQSKTCLTLSSQSLKQAFSEVTQHAPDSYPLLPAFMDITTSEILFNPCFKPCSPCHLVRVMKSTLTKLRPDKTSSKTRVMWSSWQPPSLPSSSRRSNRFQSKVPPQSPETFGWSFNSMFREICAHIAKTVLVTLFPILSILGLKHSYSSQVWPDSKFSAMGAFIFLRSVIPA